VRQHNSGAVEDFI